MMEDPTSRLLSLATWPKKHFFPNLEKISEAGFYYESSPVERESDRLYCAFCPLSLKDWKRGDRPWLEHAKYWPWCVHLQSVKGRKWIKVHACSFRPNPQNINKLQNNQLLPLLGENNERRQKFVMVGNNGYKSPNGVWLTFPDVPSMGELRNRVASLTTSGQFPLSLAREIASAGFYFTSIRIFTQNAAIEKILDSNVTRQAQNRVVALRIV